MENATTVQTRIILPELLNDRGTLFGGNLLKWMDEVAYVTATRFLHQHMVTVSVEHVKFLKPILSGNIIEIIGRMVNVGSVKVQVNVEVWISENKSDKNKKCAEGIFYFSMLNEEGKPVRIRR
ncbi:MAG: acyl-CoA thioesterase [Lentimicrobium sp.]|jgi:acyl-CoA hydrolase|nr:acyl-CoA thioesterase [Lentimicrobium sp.]